MNLTSHGLAVSLLLHWLIIFPLDAEEITLEEKFREGDTLIKSLEKYYSVPPSILPKQNTLRGRFLANDPTLFQKMNWDDYILFRHGDLSSDFLENNWVRGTASLAAGISAGEDADVRREIIYFVVHQNPSPFCKQIKDQLKKEEDSHIAEILFYGSTICDRKAFIRELEDPRTNILAKISWEDFQKRNGTEYPTAIQEMGFAATPALLGGLTNKDWRLRVQYLKIIELLKTSYNRNQILYHLKFQQKKEVHPEVVRAYMAIIEYYER